MFPSNQSFQVYMLLNRPVAPAGFSHMSPSWVQSHVQLKLPCCALASVCTLYAGEVALIWCFILLGGRRAGRQSVIFGDLWCNQQRSNFYLASSPGFPEKDGKAGVEA